MLMHTTTDPTLAVNAKDPSFFKELGTRTALACKEHSITQVRVAATLLPSSRIGEAMDFVEFHSQREGRAAFAQRLTHQAGFSAMGKRMQVADLAKTNKDEAGGFGERLAGLRKAAGFTWVELTDKRQVLQLLDAFIERGQLKRKVESRA